MPAKKEKLIKITKDEDGSEVRVYKEFDQENPYLTSGLRFFEKIMTKWMKLNCNNSR